MLRSMVARMFLGLILCSAPFMSTAATQAFKYQGFNLIAFNKGDFSDEVLLQKSFDYIVSVGSNFVNIDWIVAFRDDGSMIPSTDPASREPSQSAIQHVIDLAHQRNLKVFLKPHVGIPNSFANRFSWETDLSKFSMTSFFRDWAAYLTQLGLTASTKGVEGLVIGTEFSDFDTRNREDWKSLITGVRQVFSGKIGYDALFPLRDPFRVDQVCFWDLVDIIGVSLYVPLSKNDQASLAELNAAWRANPFGAVSDVIGYLHSLSLQYNKPVMAMEGGYQSIVGGLYDVGAVDAIRAVDNAVQAAGLASYLDTLGKYQGDWFEGVSLWSVFPPFLDERNQTLWGYTQGYMTNGKPAAEVIKKYFSGAVANSPIYQGLWWANPPGVESGWGINFAHQGDIIFATWFTYDATGKAWWLSMTANKSAEGVYSGTLYQTHGPSFSAVPFSPSAVSATPVGSGTLTFSNVNNGSFTYIVNGISQTKSITRQVFGPLPVCVFGAQSDLARATNYQDLWWAAPAGVESGWGVNFTHQGNIIFATWFTYDVDGTPLWLSATVNKTGPGVYTGTLYRTTGPAFNAVPFLPANVGLTPVGTLTLTFSNGNSAIFAYAVNGVTRTKSITRQVFRAPGTECL